MDLPAVGPRIGALLTDCLGHSRRHASGPVADETGGANAMSAGPAAHWALHELILPAGHSPPVREGHLRLSHVLAHSLLRQTRAARFEAYTVGQKG